MQEVTLTIYWCSAMMSVIIVLQTTSSNDSFINCFSHFASKRKECSKKLFLAFSRLMHANKNARALSSAHFLADLVFLLQFNRCWTHAYENCNRKVISWTKPAAFFCSFLDELFLRFGILIEENENVIEGIEGFLMTTRLLLLYWKYL